MATQPLSSNRESAVPEGQGNHGSQCRWCVSGQRYWWVVAGLLAVMVGVLLPAGRLLRADSRGTRGTSEVPGDWEIELVPRSAGPVGPADQGKRQKSQTPESGRSRGLTHREEEPAETVADEVRTPANKGWQVVASVEELSDRAVPLNAVRVGSAASSAASLRSQGLAETQKAVQGSDRRSAAGAGSVIRTASSARSLETRQARGTESEEPSARLMTPNFARRETAVESAEDPLAAEAETVSPQVVDSTVMRSGAPDIRYRASGKDAFERSRGSFPRASGRPLAGELPEAVSESERAEPLMANTSRSVAGIAGTRRTQRVQTSIEIPDNGALAEQEFADDEPRVTAPSPQRAGETRRSTEVSPYAFPFAGHSLFADPRPLPQPSPGTPTGYPNGSGAYGPSPMGPDPRYGWIQGAGYPMQSPYVVPRHSISHTGWYGPVPGVQTMTHGAPQSAVMAGHSLRDR